MQPSDSVHQETIRLVSLKVRLRKRMAAVLSTTAKLAHRGYCSAARGYKIERSAVYDVQCTLFNVKRRFLDSFAQCRVGMNSTSEVFGTAAKFNHGNRFRD
jgi:hypothetical protein